MDIRLINLLTNRLDLNLINCTIYYNHQNHNINWIHNNQWFLEFTKLGVIWWDLSWGISFKIQYNLNSDEFNTLLKHYIIYKIKPPIDITFSEYTTTPPNIINTLKFSEPLSC